MESFTLFPALIFLINLEEGKGSVNKRERERERETVCVCVCVLERKMRKGYFPVTQLAAYIVVLTRLIRAEVLRGNEIKYLVGQ